LECCKPGLRAAAAAVAGIAHMDTGSGIVVSCIRFCQNQRFYNKRGQGSLKPFEHMLRFPVKTL